MKNFFGTYFSFEKHCTQKKLKTSKQFKKSLGTHPAHFIFKKQSPANTKRTPGRNFSKDKIKIRARGRVPNKSTPQSSLPA